MTMKLAATTTALLGSVFASAALAQTTPPVAPRAVPAPVTSGVSPRYRDGAQYRDHRPEHWASSGGR